MTRITQIGIFIIALFNFNFSLAQIKGLTENGDEVILMEDGTWYYLEEKETEINSLPLNPTIFEKTPLATFPVRSGKSNMTVFINPKDWKFFKSESNPNAEFEFRHMGDEIYGLVVNEKLEIAIESLKDIALKNARRAAPDTQVEEAEYRIVNGKKLIAMKMSGTIQGMKLFYFGYYYSSQAGSTQLLTYTTQSLKEKNLPHMEMFLNGMIGD